MRNGKIFFELCKPIDSQVSLEHTDDVEEDPEYKIREDDDVPDYNDLRYDNSVKITRDELNALLAEILEFAHQELGYLDDEDDEENKIISENSAPPVTNVGLVSVENVQSQWMTSDERLQLDEQMRMYIQILTQSYLLSHGNSQLNFINISSKLFLDEMKMFASREMASNERSAFYAQNLDGALEIVNEYENHRMLLRQTNLLPLKKTVLPSVPQHVKKTLATSKVFIYPDLLPVCGFYDFHEKQKTKFSVHEDNLIALGMEQFADIKNPVDYIHTLLVPAKTKEQIKIRIKNSKVKKNPLDNPIKFYHVYKQAPLFQRTVRIFDPYNIKAPEDYPSEILPKWMESYSKVGIHAHVQPLIAPSQPKETAKTPVAIVRPMFRKPLEARKLNPILPRVPVLSLNGISRIKRLPPKQYAKPILKPALATIFPKPDGLKDEAKKELLSLKKTVTFNVSPSVLTSLSLSQAVSIPSIPETQIMKQTSSKPFIASTPLRTQPDTETLDEIDEDIIEEDHDLISTATPANNTNGKKQAPTLMKDDPKKEDREVLFANSYLLRASEILKGSPEIYEKFLSVLCKYHQSTRPPVELYLEIKETLKDYPALVRDFIIFLKPEQAKECGKYKELVALNKIREFFRKVEMHFKNQPQHITRILRILAQLHHQVDITSAEVITALQPMLRNQSHLMEELYNLLPDANPPEYLMTDFESVDIPNSDEDNSSVDSCEDIIIPDTPDLYGGKECPCDCHTSSTDNKMLNRSRHCIKCGVKFIDGRIYIQTGKVLKPAQVTYHDLPCSSAGKKKAKNQPVSSKVQRPFEVPSKTTPNVQVKNTAPAPSIGINGKVDNMASQKDVPKFTNDAPVFSQDEAPRLSSNKLPCDVIEDTIFPSKIKWTRDDDRLIIYNCQRYGISRKAFSTSAAVFQNRTIEQVQGRLLNLMEILSEEMKRH
ncbi:GON-4-like protein [Caerostris extrusa]|uniref:GON-4-like protein n=1 Tax=Caerostris extrusa TaxID=172846 RepID=A0AAV4UKN6_CAEEX|nr:GON-4-like protein [Caerostris extrusa]